VGCKSNTAGGIGANIQGLLADVIRWEETEHLWNKFSTKKPPTGGIISNFPPRRAETLPCGALVCATAHAPHCNVSAALRVLGGEQKD